MSSAAPSEAGRCLILAPDTACPASLLRGLAGRGLAPEVVASAPEIMLTLARRPAMAVLLVEPAGHRWLDDLLSALARYHPQVACWRYDRLSGVQPLRSGNRPVAEDAPSEHQTAKRSPRDAAGAAPAASPAAQEASPAESKAPADNPPLAPEPLPFRWPFDLPTRRTSRIAAAAQHQAPTSPEENVTAAPPLRSAALLSEEELAMLLGPLEEEGWPSDSPAPA